MTKEEMEVFITGNNIDNNYFVKNDIFGRPHIVDYECEESLFYYKGNGEIILKEYAYNKFHIIGNKIMIKK